MIQLGTAGGQGIAVMVAYWAAAVLNNGLARYEEAASAAREVTANAIDPWESMWALAELVEAAARAGDMELARDALNRLAETTQPCGTEFALGIEARCRALLSDGATADDSIVKRSSGCSRTQLRPELARAHLLYAGVAASRRPTFRRAQQLRTAHDMLRCDRDGGVRRARPPRADRNGREDAQAQRPDARRAHASGAPDRPACPGRLVEPGDRRAALHQCTHRSNGIWARCSPSSESLPQGASGSPSRARRASPRAPSADAAPTRTRAREFSKRRILWYWLLWGRCPKGYSAHGGFP